MNADTKHLAKQVLCGEFDGADARTTGEIFLQLDLQPDPVCRVAAALIANDFLRRHPKQQTNQP